jgi:hypothetical protein
VQIFVIGHSTAGPIVEGDYDLSLRNFYEKVMGMESEIYLKKPH